MVLLLNEYLPDLFSHGEFAKGFTLPNSLAVIPDGFVLVVEIEPSAFRVDFGQLDGFRSCRWHRAQIVDLTRNN